MTLVEAPWVATDFTRLSPWSIVHFAARTLAQLLSNSLALIPLIYGAYKVDNVLIVIGGVVLLCIVVLGSALLRHLYFSYAIDNQGVQVRQGVLAKKNLNLKFSRIQNVNIEHPLYFRPLDLVTVKIDGAGSAGEEVYLAALTRKRGEQIREYIRRQQSGLPVASTTTEQTPALEPASTLVLTRDLVDLIIHGLTNNRAWIILGALAAIYGQAGDAINSFIAGLGFDFQALIANAGILALLVIFAGALTLAVIIMAGLSVLGSILSYYRFELHRTDQTFTVFRGLLTRHEINLKKSRIQAVRVRRDWLDMALGRMNVILQQIRHSEVQTPGQSQDKHILIPSVEPHHTDLLMREALADIRINALVYTGISRRYFIKGAVIISLVYLGIACALASRIPFSFAWLTLMLPVVGAHIFLYHLHWQRWGIAVDGEIMVIRRGLVGVDHLVIPAYKIQEVARVQTPLMRRHGLSTITLSVASTSVTVPFLRDQEVRALINYCLFVTEATDRSWM